MARWTIATCMTHRMLPLEGEVEDAAAPPDARPWTSQSFRWANDTVPGHGSYPDVSWLRDWSDTVHRAAPPQGDSKDARATIIGAPQSPCAVPARFSARRRRRGEERSRIHPRPVLPRRAHFGPHDGLPPWHFSPGACRTSAAGGRWMCGAPSWQPATSHRRDAVARARLPIEHGPGACSTSSMATRARDPVRVPVTGVFDEDQRIIAPCVRNIRGVELGAGSPPSVTCGMRTGRLRDDGDALRVRETGPVEVSGEEFMNRPDSAPSGSSARPTLPSAWKRRTFRSTTGPPRASSFRGDPARRDSRRRRDSFTREYPNAELQGQFVRVRLARRRSRFMRRDVPRGSASPHHGRHRGSDGAS